MARRTAVLDQPSLFDDPDATPTPPTISKKEKVQSRRRRHHTLGLPRPWPKHPPCAAICLTCKRPEDIGACSGGCAIVCGRPDRTGPVEVCLITLTLPARTTPDGRHAVIACPHCGHTHWHTPTPGRSYRVGQCGQPYTIHVPTT
jgi:hypothetical protein